MSTNAPAAVALLEQATARHPGRIDIHDGLKGDERHEREAPNSWHLARVPRTTGGAGSGPRAPDGRVYVRDERGVVYAVDLSDSPAHGLDVHAFVRDLVRRGDRRVAEAISKREIWSKARAAEGWREYTGENPHVAHAHISIDPRFADDVSSWWDEEDDMTPEQAAKLDRLVIQMSDVLARVTDLQRAVRDLQEAQGPP